MRWDGSKEAFASKLGKRFVDLAALAIRATMMGQLARFAVWWVVLVHNVSHLCFVCGAKGPGGHVSLDTFASQPEESWFDPALHETSIQNFLETWGGWACNQVMRALIPSLWILSSAHYVQP